jgi:predicted AAA+ superfamily ATPase
MFTRTISVQNKKSFFLLGPRGTGKSTWIRSVLKPDVYLDLLDPAIYHRLLASPENLPAYIPAKTRGWVAIDEVQRIPELLNVVHQLIETRGLAFALTGSSARKLRRGGVNLLAGRALTNYMHPLTCAEVGPDFDLGRALRFGMLPSVFSEPDPARYLASYVQTYLREEVQQEGLTRNIAAFARFLEAASFSQGTVLNVSDVARDCAVERKVVEGYFTILEDLMIGARVPVFTKRAKRKTQAHPKFYFFDAGVYRAIRPAGPLDDADVIPGAALETLVFHELRALNHYHNLGYELFYWRTTAGTEVDFVLYGKRGIRAIEVKSSPRLARDDLTGLRAFRTDYPEAECALIYGGNKELEVDGIAIRPAAEALGQLKDFI